MSVEEITIVIALFLFGICVGSFLNVCIVRMPKEKSIVFPSSHCVSCQKPLPWYDNIPLISYILLLGKCRFCKTPFSFRYFLVELLMGMIFVLFYLYFGLTAVLWPYLFMMGCFVVATFVDFGHRIIPDEITIGGMWAGLIFSLIVPSMHTESITEIFYGRMFMRILLVVFILSEIYQYFKNKNEDEHKDIELSWKIYFLIGIFVIFDWVISLVLGSVVKEESLLFAIIKSLDASIIGILVAGGLIYLLGVLGDILFKKESMGGGDIKLLAMIGSFLGWQMAILAFFIAPFFGAIFGIIEKIRTKDSYIAYGPFLILGAIIALFKGKEILIFILNGHFLF